MSRAGVLLLLLLGNAIGALAVLPAAAAQPPDQGATATADKATAQPQSPDRPGTRNLSKRIFKGAIVILSSSFMALTAISFLRFRLEKKKTEFSGILRTLGIEEPKSEQGSESTAVMKEYSSWDYGLPVAFATFICLFGFTLVFFGGEFVESSESRTSIVMTGMHLPEEPETRQFRRQSLVALTMAFLGAFAWSAQNIIRRLITADLAPGSYYSAGLRIIFACTVAILLAWFLEDLPGSTYTRGMIPAIAFLSGMVPEEALVFMRSKVKIFSDARTPKADRLSLDMIEGINVFHRVRLEEVGIDNGQNLAEANLVELLLRTPFNPDQLIDWIAQARLYIYFKSELNKLRGVGIRTVFDLMDESWSEEDLERLAEAAQISPLLMTVAHRRIRNDRANASLMEIHSRLGNLQKISSATVRG